MTAPSIYSNIIHGVDLIQNQFIVWCVCVHSLINNYFRKSARESVRILINEIGWMTWLPLLQTHNQLRMYFHLMRLAWRHVNRDRLLVVQRTSVAMESRLF